MYQLIEEVLEGRLKKGKSKEGLKYKALDPKRIEGFVAVDGSFPVNYDNSSQIGLVAMVRI